MTRQDSGWYLFGTKKVYLKLEMGSIKIKTGGGFYHIDEFLELYSK